jgi:hypothetical protein
MVRQKKEAKMSNDHHGELVRRYQTEGISNAVDIKFLLRNSDEATLAELTAEWTNLDTAVKNGQVEAIELGELRWKD